VANLTPAPALPLPSGEEFDTRNIGNLYECVCPSVAVCWHDLGTHGVILGMTGLPQIDATGMVALDTHGTRLKGLGVVVVLACVQDDRLGAMERAGWLKRDGMLVAESVEGAAEICRAVLE